jgi:methylenetetrahydrofolate dehydrogenase (NADP+)/methenyltetrahydrofolate cyclohydrolase
VIAGAGQPHFIKPEHLKEGVVLLDAGTSEIAGVIQGDVDPSCAAKAAVFTPVPGGIGPIAVSMIFKNILDLTRRD